MAPLRDGEGAIEGGMVLSQDITAMSHFRAAFEQSSLGMGLIAPDGRHVRVNEALCRITGYEPEQLLATTVYAVTHPDDVASGAAGRADLLAGRIPVLRTEKRYLHAAGHTVRASVHATVVRDADGNPTHILDHVALIECTGGSAAATSNQLVPASPDP
jgi:PAS domain S-box-containing protein